MGYRDAIEDGIQFDGSWYKIPCQKCKTEYVRSSAYSRKRTYICKTCKSIAEGEKDTDQAITKEIRFRQAVSRIEVLVDDIEKYKGAIAAVYKTLHHKGWYRSTEEVMVAIELVQKGVKTIHQQKIGKYSVDFALPEYKVLLEIDGKPFHNNHTLEKEGIRDGSILLAVGVDWEMIRIDTDKVNKNIEMLLPSILEILEYRKQQNK